MLKSKILKGKEEYFESKSFSPKGGASHHWPFFPYYRCMEPRDPTLVALKKTQLVQGRVKPIDVSTCLKKL